MSLVAAQQLGIAQATLDIALAFAKEREQFGRTIGSFQAIKHLLADMFARQELARAAVYAAGASLDHPEVGDVEQTVRGAKIVADYPVKVDRRAFPTVSKYTENFVHLIEKVRTAGFDPGYRQHVSKFDLNHPHSVQTLTSDEARR